MLGIHLPEYELFGIDGVLILVSVAVAALGIGIGIWLFGFFGADPAPRRWSALTRRNALTRSLYTASQAKWWFDDLNHLVFFRFGGAVADAVMWFDVRVIDGIVNGTGTVTQLAGDGIRRIQTGRVQNYALGIALGLAGHGGALHLHGALMDDFLARPDLLSLLIFTPLVGAVVLAFVPGDRLRAVRAVALLTASVALVISGFVALSFDATGRASSSSRRSTGSASSASSTASAWTASRSCWCCSRRC